MSLKVNFSWTLLSRVIYALSQWLLLIVIARLGTSGQLDQFAYAIALVSPFIILSQLNLRGFISTERATQFQTNDYLVTQYLSLLIALICIVIITYLSSVSPETAIILFFVFLYKAFESVSSIYYGILQKHNFMKEVAISVIVHGMLAIIAIAISMLFFESVLYGVILVSLLWFTVLVLYDKKSETKCVDINTSLTTTNRKSVVSIFAQCFPFGLTLFLVSVRIYLPVYCIQVIASDIGVGAYSALVYFLIAGTMITSSVLQVVTPTLINYIRKNDNDSLRKLLSRQFKVSLLMGALGIVGAISIGENTLRLVYGDNYSVYSDSLTWVMCSAAVLYVSQVFGLVLTIERRTRELLLVNVLAIISTIVCCMYFIPSSGVLGATQALFVGSLIVCLFNAYYGIKEIKYLKLLFNKNKYDNKSPVVD